MARALVLWCLFCLWDQSFGLTYNYAEILSKSIWFYEAQRSGKLPANNRVPWRGDSALDDGKDVGLDLTGGYYDAGDHVKFGFPMACVATVLSWGVLEFPDGYTKAGEMDNVLESLRWAFDYFIKCHPSKYEFYGQVGNGHTDHSFWGRPEEMNMYRPAYKITQHAPGSELAGETAAAMAAGYLVFRSRDSAYAHTLLSHARDLYDFAVEYQGDYSDSITNARDFYRSWNGYRDELAWGAAWLLRATGEARYRNYNDLHYESSTNGFGWDDKNAGVQLLMYITTQEEKYRNDVMRTVNSWMPGGNVIYTPKGLAWLNEWGSLRHAANLAAIAMIAANHGVRTNEYRDWADTQMNYILGSTGRSFVCGYGVNPPVQPHHRAASCDDLPAPCGQADESKSGPNPQILHGALVGGPDRYDNYVDIRSDYKANEVATDYNAGFQTALAAFVSIKQ